MDTPRVVPSPTPGQIEPGSEPVSSRCALPECGRRLLFSATHCRRHRVLAKALDDGPDRLSILRRSEEGSIYERSSKNGSYRKYSKGELTHRLDGPAITEWSDNGEIAREEWWREGKRHRVGGPAEVRFGSQAVVEKWYLDGKLSRLDGPAEVTYRKGRYLVEDWWLAGWHSTAGPESFRHAISTVPPEDLLAAVRASRFTTCLDAGHSAAEIVTVIGEGVSTPEGVREVLGGAPVEWIRAFEGAAPS